MRTLVLGTPAEPVHYLSRLITSSGERFTLLKDRRTGLPDPWTTRYNAGRQRTQAKAETTIARALSAIVLALQWGLARGIDLDARLDSLELFTAEETGDLINWLGIGRATDKKRRHRLSVNADTRYTRAMVVRQYFVWRSEHALHRISVSSGRYGDASRKLEDWKRLLGQSIRIVQGEGKSAKMGLPEELRLRFLEVIQPDYPDNPFEPRHRKRNFALLIMYFKLGVRRAEPLVLKSADLILAGSKPRICVHGRPDDPEDPRPDQPSVKTADRILHIDSVLLKALLDWLVCRGSARLYPGAKRQPFVFVAENGRPLAGRTVYDLFVIIREAFPEFPPDLSPHSLRHDWNDRFSELCDSVREGEAIREGDPETRLTDAREASMRNYLMGWKKNSKTGVLYTARSTERQAQELSLKMQERLVDG